MVETTNFLGFSTPDFFRGGSEKARNYLRGLIDSPDEINVAADDAEASYAYPNGEMNLGINEINNWKESFTDAGYSSQIMDFGMTFLHETLHTKAGAKVWDPNRTTGYVDPVNRHSSDEEKQKAYMDGKTGQVADRINELRKELKIPARANYVSKPGHFQINNGKVIEVPLKK